MKPKQLALVALVAVAAYLLFTRSARGHYTTDGENIIFNVGPDAVVRDQLGRVWT